MYGLPKENKPRAKQKKTTNPTKCKFHSKRYAIPENDVLERVKRSLKKDVITKNRLIHGEAIPLASGPC